MVLLFYGIMKVDFIPFQIGEEYENWEFELNYEEETKSFDKYQYIGNEFSELLGLEVKNCHLYFNMDILAKVNVELKSEKLNDFYTLGNVIDIKTAKKGFMKNISPDLLRKEWMIENSLLSLQYNFEFNSVFLLYKKRI